MAIRFAINPPTREDGNEVAKWTCEECGDTTVVDPHTHAVRRHRSKEKAVILDSRYLAWYNPDYKENEDG